MGRAAEPIGNHLDILFNPASNLTFSPMYHQAVEFGVTITLVPKLADQTTAASYEVISNTIEVLELKVPKTTGKSRKWMELPVEDQMKLSTAHELYHAVRWGNILGSELSPSQRLQKLDRQARAVTEDAFVEVSWKEECAAESFAWRSYYYEIAVKVARLKRQPPRIDFREIDAGIQQLLQDFAGNYADYEARFRKIWRDAQARASAPATGQVPARSDAKVVVVTHGDPARATLSGIAAKEHKDWQLWPLIWDANRDLIPNPNRLQSGMSLTVYPTEHYTTEQIQDARHRAPTWKNYPT